MADLPLDDKLREVIVGGSDDEILDEFEAYAKRHQDVLKQDVLVGGRSYQWLDLLLFPRQLVAGHD